MRIGVGVGSAENREDRAGERALGKQRPQLGRKGEIAQAHAAHDVVHDAGVAGAQALGRPIRHRFPFVLERRR